MMLRQLCFFPPRKAFGFLKFFGTGFTPYLCYVLFRGPEEATTASLGSD